MYLLYKFGMVERIDVNVNAAPPALAVLVDGDNSDTAFPVKVRGKSICVPFFFYKGSLTLGLAAGFFPRYDKGAVGHVEPPE